MASEDNFLRLDPYNYDTELEKLLAEEVFTFNEYKTFYENGKMSINDFEVVKDWFDIR